MKTDITGIAKNILQVRSSLKAEASSDPKEEKLSVSFFELMSQNTVSSNAKTASGSDELVYRVEAKGSNTTQTAYDTSANPVKNVSVKEEVPPEEILSETPELLEEYEEEVRSALKELLGVTDEEIDKILESLGLSITDLGNIQDLTAFVQEVTGEDIGALFLSEDFQNLKNQISEATETLCAELGITKEEWKTLAESISQQMQPSEEAAESTKAPDNMENMLQAEEPEDTAAKQEAVSGETPHAAEAETQKAQTAAIVQKADEPQKETVFAEQPEEVRQETEHAVQGSASMQQEAEDASEDSGFGAKKQELPEQMKNTAADAANEHIHAAAFAESRTVSAEEFAVPREAAAVPYANQADAMELIEQIARQVRVTVSAGATSMELQLNPENLGKIYLNITEKEGAIRAQFAAQNQTVKEALETQVAELRQTLNQQGIKVDAIEVTVASHEFEQNLEENARQEEQMRQQMEESQKNARRSLNLSELDELSGLMTEEERLVAQIMRDNGNQVDLTA